MKYHQLAKIVKLEMQKTIDHVGVIDYDEDASVWLLAGASILIYRWRQMRHGQFFFGGGY